MSFFGNIGKAIGNAAKQIYNATINRPPTTLLNQENGVVHFNIRSSLPNANAVNKALFHIFLDKSVAARHLDLMGQAAVQIVQDIVEPLRRKQSDSFVDSFTHKIDASNNSVTIYSNHPAAHAIQYGINRAGSVQSIQEWMRTKEEFDGLEPKEERKISYAIKASIDKKYPPGSNSTLGQLAPQGERRFDYIGEATEILHREINTMIQNLYNELQGT